jgi:lipopolysaccharide assembly outer membrane protein LptD (OstA)
MKKKGFLFSMLAAALICTSAYAAQHVNSRIATNFIIMEDVVPVVKSYARDSTKYSTDRKVISFYGDARVDTKDVSVVADEIVYDATSQTLKIRNLHSLKLRNKEEQGKLEGSSLTLKLVNSGYKVVK